MMLSIPKLNLIALTFALSAGAALAAVTPEQVAAGYTAQGYTRVEIRTGPTQMKVEAIRGTEKLEVILDTATGTVLKSETETVGAFENTRPGISLRDRSRDFVRANAPSDDTDRDDQGRDDDDDDALSGNDDGPDHDANDDHGEDDDHGGNSGHGGGDDDDDDDDDNEDHGGGDD